MSDSRPTCIHLHNHRVIIDLSFPAGQSVNAEVDPDRYLGSKFLLTLPTIDTITSKLIKLGRGALLYKVNTSADDYKYLGLHFQYYFIDSCLLFGFRHYSSIFQGLSDTVRYFMATEGYHVTKYVDDIIGYETRSKAQASFDTLCNLLQELGYKIFRQNKLFTLTSKTICLGIEL